MSTDLHNMTHGIQGLKLAYTLMLAANLAALLRGRASVGKFLLSPLVTAPMMVFAGIVIALTSPLLRAFGIGSEDLLQVVFGVGVTVMMGYAAGRVLAGHSNSLDPGHRRGAVVTPTQPGITRRRDDPVSHRHSDPTSTDGPCITLAGVPIPLLDETKHFKIIGTTGTGKSTAIREILEVALARGDRAIIADPDGGYARRFYDPTRGDVILNPFHGNGYKWDLFGEIINKYDIDQLARSLIPDSGDPDRIWCEYARTFFIEVVRQCIKVGETNDRELYRLVKAAPVGELRKLLAETAAAPFLEEGLEKLFGSLRAVASSALKVLEYTTEQQGTPFSVRQWVREGKAKKAGGRGGVLFIPYSAGEIASLRSVISAWMRLGIFEAMDREEGDQRLWFVVDELDALGEIDGLKDALARLRKFGGRCILGFQSIAQVSGTYGKGTADTIVENCGNTYILRCSASEHGGTSEFASKLIGQREVLHTVQSATRQSRWHWKSSITTSQQIKIEPAVMASEVERLPDLEGFLKVASVPDWQLVRLTLRSEPATIHTWGPKPTASPLASTPTPTADAPASTAPATPPPTAASAPTIANSRAAAPSPTSPPSITALQAAANHKRKQRSSN